MLCLFSFKCTIKCRIQGTVRWNSSVTAGVACREDWQTASCCSSSDLKEASLSGMITFIRRAFQQNISAALFLISKAGRHHSRDLFESAECYLWLLICAARIEDLGKNTSQLMAALFKIILLPIIAAAEDSSCTQQLWLMWQSMLCASDRCQHEPAIMVQMPNCSFSVSVKQNKTRQEKLSCPKTCSAKPARLERTRWSLLWEPRALKAGERGTKNGVFSWCIDQMSLCTQPPSNFL